MKGSILKIPITHTLSAKEVIQYITICILNKTEPLTRDAILHAMESHLWAGGICYIEKKYQETISSYELNNRVSAKPQMERAERLARKYFPELFQGIETFSITFIKSEA